MAGVCMYVCGCIDFCVLCVELLGGEEAERERRRPKTMVFGGRVSQGSLNVDAYGR